MIIITAARKPFVGTNAANLIRFGSGCLNIDATRIQAEQWDVTQMEKQCNAPNSLRMRVDVAGERREQGGFPRSIGRGPIDASKGRWPANIILEHRPGCVFLGTEKVKGNKGNDAPVGVSNYKNQVYGHGMGGAGHPGFADDSGMEVVDFWDCCEDCPVLNLERLGGRSKSSPTPDHVNKGSMFIASAVMRGGTHTDEGKAARYFKQVQDK